MSVTKYGNAALYICTTEAELPTYGIEGERAYAADTGVFYERRSGAWRVTIVAANRTSDPASPAVGDLWLRTDL